MVLLNGNLMLSEKKSRKVVSSQDRCFDVHILDFVYLDMQSGIASEPPRRYKAYFHQDYVKLKRITLLTH